MISHGYEVSVITTTPHYNYDDDFKNVSKKNILCRTTNYFGAKVYHFPQNKSKSLILRGVNILGFHIFFLIRALSLKKIDYILTPSPPLTSGFLSGVIAKIKGAKSIYNVQEIYPDVLIKQGDIKNKYLLALLKSLEKWTYKLSSKVVTIHELFSERISSRLDHEKLVCIPNFIDTDLYKPFEGEFTEEWKYNDRFIVGYVGNLGKVQDWKTILYAAEQMMLKEPKVLFVLVGGGSDFEYLKSFESQLSNLKVLPYQNRSMVPMINSRIDLHIIAMTESSDYDGLPSKAYAILSSGRPILAATNADTPLANLVVNSGNGIVVPRSNVQSILDGIIEFLNGNDVEKHNLIGRSFVVDNFSKEVVTSKYLELIQNI
jgi:glycosyltransferase involved in cell wall biosynthesis